MKKYWYKFLTWLGFIVEEESHKQQEAGGDLQHKIPADTTHANIVSIHQKKPVKIIFICPTDYDHVQSIAEHLKNMRVVIVNMEEVDRSLAKRIMDFLSGITYAISGSMQKLNPNIIIVLPQTYVLVNSTENKESIINRKDYFPFNTIDES